MAVIHILKDGTILNDISGHIVRVEYARELYEYIATINAERKA